MDTKGKLDGTVFKFFPLVNNSRIAPQFFGEIDFHFPGNLDLIPRISRFKEPYLPFFCSEYDAKYIDKNIDRLRKHYLDQQNTEINTELLEPKPAENNNFCPFCRCRFDHYLEHIEHPSHLQHMQKYPAFDSLILLVNKLHYEFMKGNNLIAKSDDSFRPQKESQKIAHSKSLNTKSKRSKRNKESISLKVSLNPALPMKTTQAQTKLTEMEKQSLSDKASKSRVTRITPAEKPTANLQVCKDMPEIRQLAISAHQLVKQNNNHQPKQATPKEIDFNNEIHKHSQPSKINNCIKQVEKRVSFELRELINAQFDGQEEVVTKLKQLSANLKADIFQLRKLNEKRRPRIANYEAYLGLGENVQTKI